ncbi:hypothetical protein TREPR_0766 [Treponema primitia ZAS-2]|uniref:Uncharacterized protein n=1 Tax=Treponema primitia (strain ATCC BAA-887 / DSM 12427 / ZAS-2) TaxID=545694 RepID=F5YJC5_TREPZ|nr:hypothetical protein TREPR_0766 [Treponema primitia ZAS-2]
MLIAFFLFLPLIRPFVKNLWGLDGLSLLPLLALGIFIGLFPAYGIRPECLPLGLYVIFLNWVHLSALSSVFQRMRNDDFRDRGPVASGIYLGVLIAVTALAVYFAPSLDMDLEESGVSTSVIHDQVRNVNLYLRVYAPSPDQGRETPGAPGLSGQALRKGPLLLLVPPAAGSVLVVDRLCEDLSRRGFTVLSYSRQGVDAPAVRETGAKQLLSPVRSIRLFQAIFQGTRRAAANNLGRAIEEERMRDLEFLIASIRNRGDSDPPLPVSADRSCIFIAAYGAGGAALTTMASVPGFAGKNPAIRGIISLEGPILSALGHEPLKTPGLSRTEAGFLRFLLADIGARLSNLRPRKIAGFDALPSPEIPAFFILSDRALYSRYRERRYMSVLECFRKGNNPAALARVPGAGPLDYSDVPKKYPLLSLLFPGDLKPIWSQEEYIPGTASLITNFAAAILQDDSLRRTPLEESIYIDINRAWYLAPREYILGL